MTGYATNALALGPDIISADSLAKVGLAVVMLIVFAESGLLVGFFLPGDSLLFTLGLLISRNEVSTPLWLACVLVALAAVVGDQVGYLFGRNAGPALFRRPDSRLFRQDYVDQAHRFFEKHGPCSIVLARFVPVVRTFTPVIAGVSAMEYRIFATYNIAGGVLWGFGITVLGFFLGQIDFIRQNLEMMLILIVLISAIPIIIELVRARRRKAVAAGLIPGRHQARHDGDDVLSSGHVDDGTRRPRDGRVYSSGLKLPPPDRESLRAGRNAVYPPTWPEGGALSLTSHLSVGSIDGVPRSTGTSQTTDNDTLRR